VRSFAADSSGYEGSLQVRGVVSRVFPSRSAFLMIDYREYQACGTITCAAVVMPVTHDGDMPRPMEAVVATGEVVSTATGLALGAQRLRNMGE